MPDPNAKAIIMVTRQNLDWAVERTGHSREYLLKALERAEAEKVVCTVQER